MMKTYDTPDMKTWVYVTAPTGTVHLVESDRWFSEYHAPTVCGRDSDGMPEGDETATGFAATCKTCKGRYLR